MNRVLHLTTPLMHGRDVKSMQLLLIHGGYLKSAPDGVYGVHTAQAAYRAKFWLGYIRCDQSAGDELRGYLNNSRKPGPAMRILAAKRRADQKRKQKKNKGLNKGQVVLQHACSQLGETEHPSGSNRSKFSLWYGVIGAWCAMFCTWCSVNTFKAWKRGQFYAYVPFVRGDAVAGRRGLAVTSAPRSGDYVIYDWDHDGTGDHIGIYADEKDLKRFTPVSFQKALAEFGALGAGDFWAVEGNTGVGNDSNGGKVMIRKRNRGLVQTFVRAS